METKSSKKIKPNVRFQAEYAMDNQVSKNPYYQMNNQSNLMFLANFKVNWILKC